MEWAKRQKPPVFGNRKLERAHRGIWPYSRECTVGPSCWSRHCEPRQGGRKVLREHSDVGLLTGIITVPRSKNGHARSTVRSARLSRARTCRRRIRAMCRRRHRAWRFQGVRWRMKWHMGTITTKARIRTDDGMLRLSLPGFTGKRNNRRPQISFGPNPGDLTVSLEDSALSHDERRAVDVAHDVGS